MNGFGHAGAGLVDHLQLTRALAGFFRGAEAHNGLHQPGLAGGQGK
jgi:hypothetical protein